MVNLTDDGNHTKIQELFTPLHDPLTNRIIISTFTAINIPLAITAFLGNVLIIVALQKVSSLHSPSKLLLGCLASTDLCVDLITQPVYVYSLLLSSEHSNHGYYSNILNNTTSIVFCGVSFLTLTAISVDRLLALLLGLRYRQVVTLRRVWISVVTFWLCFTVVALLYFYDSRIKDLSVSTITPLCLMTSAFLLYKNIPHTTTTSSSSTGPCSPRTAERRRNSIEYSTIQKDSVDCTVGADNISGLLPSICYSSNLNLYWIINTNSGHRIGRSNNSYLLKLYHESIHVLLKNQGSETSSEEHNHTVSVLFLELAVL